MALEDLRATGEAALFERAIPLNLAEGLVSGDSGDAASTVSCRAGLIETWDRGAKIRISRRGTHVEELLGRKFAVEDVPAKHPQLLFHVIRTDDLAMED